MDPQMKPQQLRKIQAAAADELNDQIWPVNLALIVLAGFVVGLVLVTSRFDDPRILHNAFFRLATVGLTLTAWFVGIRWLRGKMRRRLKICVLFSLLCHLWLLMSLGVGYYKLVVHRDEGDGRAVEELALTTVPDYQPEKMEHPDAPGEYARPVETKAPKATAPETVKQENEHPPQPDKKPTAEPQPPAPQQPDAIELKRREITAPRRDDAAAQLSRQELKQPSQPERPIPQPEIKPVRSPEAPAAKVDAIERQKTEAPRAQRRLPQDEPLAAIQREVARLIRQGSRAEPQPDRIATPAPTERIVRPAEVPQTEAKAPQPAAAAEEPRPMTLKPREMDVRHQAHAPAASKQSEELAPQVVQAVVRSPARQHERDWRPEIAQTPDRVPSRQPHRAEIAAEAAESEEAPAAPQRQPDLHPSAQARVDRRDPSPTPVGTPRAANAVEMPSAAMAILQSQPRRMEQPGTPALQLAAGPPDQLARQASVSPNLTPGRVEQPTVVEAAPAGDPGDATPTESPAAQQEYRTAGLPGNRQSQALSGAMAPVTGQGAPLPSAAARRARASQRGDEAMNVAPDAVAMLPRGRPGTDLPSSAEPIEESSTAGGDGPAANSGGIASRLDAGSHTAVQKTAAGSPVGRSGSSPGAELSVSPGPVGVLAGRARSGGAGIPALATNTAAPQIGRTPGAGPGLAGLGGTAAESVPGIAGGGPPAAPGPAQPGPDGTVTTIARTGGPALPGGGPAGKGIEAGLGGTPGSAGQIVGVGGAVAAALLGRARAGGDPLPGPVADGGLPGPIRKMGRLPAAELAGEVPEIVGIGTANGGRATGGPSAVIDAGPSGLNRQASGLPGDLVARMPVDGATLAGPAATAPGTAVGPRRRPGGDGQGPSLAAELGGGPLGRSNVPGLPSGDAESIGTGTGGATAQGRPSQSLMAGGPGVGDVGRQAGGGLPVRVAALPGPGGLGSEPSLSVGLPSRHARPESDVVHNTPGRFLIERTSGLLTIDARAEGPPAEAYRQRDPGKRSDEARKHGGTPSSERAVERGLEFLTRAQFPDGHWSLSQFPERTEAWQGEKASPPDAARLVAQAGRLLAESPSTSRERKAIETLVDKHQSTKTLTAEELKELARAVRTVALAPGEMESDTAATGLGLLAFLGAGYTHRDEKYRATVARALQWLLANQQPNGDLFTRHGGSNYAWYYSHGIGAIALCEAYGMTKDPRLREPAERAIRFIAWSQDPARGGWRYRPREESDTSVSGWQLMALKSGQMAGLKVPEETVERVSQWLDLAQAPGGDASRYVYNPYAEDTPEQQHGRQPSRAMTAEALLMRMYLGWQRDNTALVKGADYLRANLPEVGTLEQPTRDAYYWYYATQVMFQMQGKHWEAWNGRLQPLLEKSQVQEGPLAGSWHPDRPVPDRWGASGGRLYVSTINLLMLEVYYRHLPLYKTLRE
jgi:hypothetical protein